MTEFWPSLWATAESLDAIEPTDTLAPALVSALRDDLLLQEYVFTRQHWANGSWLPTFIEFGLFSTPPPVLRSGTTMRARAWPAMRYITALAEAQPDRVARILGGLHTDNWWVVADGLEAANRLPHSLAIEPIMHLLAQWQSATVSWTNPSVIADSLLTLDRSAAAESPLPIAVVLVVDKLWSDGDHRYDIDEVLNRLQASLGPTRFRVATGIELALATRVRSSRWGSHAFGPRLEDLRSDRSDPAELLASRWLTLTEDEATSTGIDATLIRAIRLLAIDDGLIRQMGLRCLRQVLDARPDDAVARRLLLREAEDRDVLGNEAEISELLPLFGAHFGLLPTETQLRLVGRILDLAESDKEVDHLYASDWLNALRAYLGPREHTISQGLRAPREGFRTPRAEVSFVGPSGPLDAESASALAASDFVALMRHVPQVSTEFGHSSVETVAALARAEVQRRPAEFLGYLPAIATEVGDSAILHHLVWGLKEAFRTEDSRSAEGLDRILRFLRDISARAANGTLNRDDADQYGDRSVLTSVADFMDDLAPWVLTASETAVLVETLEFVLGSNSPTPDYEHEFGGANMDPPTLALNTARGRGTRALLRLLADASADDAPGRRHLSELTVLASSRVLAEVSPGVKSSFGLFLPWLALRTPDLWRQIYPQLLPQEGNEATWESVFTTYMTFNGANRVVAKDLQSTYALAVTRLQDDSFTFLQKHADRLLQHLISLSLPNDDNSATWFGLLLQGLATAPPSEARDALSSLGHAIKREGLSVDVAWCLSLAQRRLTSDPRPSSVEAGGFLDLLFAVGASPKQAGGEILALMHAGGDVRTWSLVEYLSEHDSPRSGLGVQILITAAESGEFDGYQRDPEQLEALLSDYASAFPALTWKLVNQLGAIGGFFVEPIARRLAEEAQGDAGRP